MIRSLLIPGISALLLAASAHALDIALPTANDALFRGGGAEFFQYIQRDFEGEKSTPWEGGQYGFVRNPSRTAKGIAYTRFHEGIDIRPVSRGPDGAPTDVVRAIADGKVAHVSPDARGGYGRYVVIEHRWGGCPYYSLYGHLRSASATVGQTVSKGAPIGLMGWTGEGLDIARAHVHLEIDLLISERFEEWHTAMFPTEHNTHGIFNGLNLEGIDPAAIFLANRADPNLSIPAFLATRKPLFKVLLPASPNLTILQRYPWLVRGSPGAKPASWEFAFDSGGVPLSATPSKISVDKPTLSWAGPAPFPYAYCSRNFLAGTPANPRLTATGIRMLKLYSFPD